MDIKIDLSNYTGNWEQLMRDFESMPKECALECAKLVHRSMEFNAPFLTGLLMSTIEVVEGPGRFEIYPWVEYAPFPLFYGRAKGVQYATTYFERALKGAEDKFEITINAKCNEIIGGR